MLVKRGLWIDRLCNDESVLRQTSGQWSWSQLALHDGWEVMNAGMFALLMNAPWMNAIGVITSAPGYRGKVNTWVTGCWAFYSGNVSHTLENVGVTFWG